MKGKRMSVYDRAGSKEPVGPNLVIDGPPAPGSYPTTPDRSLVRMADPRIEDQIVPSRQKVGVGNRNGKPDLKVAEEGTGVY